MKNLTETPTKRYLPGFTALDETFKKKLTTCEAVFFLGTLKRDKPVLYFLIITSDDEERNGFCLNSMVEESCRNISAITVFVHNANMITSAVNGGNYFFSSILLHKKLIYLSGNLILPVPKGLNYVSLIEKAVKIWERWDNMSTDFLSGASFYLEQKNYRLALFLLHQSTECVLKAINRAMTGYRIEVHNLSRLLVISTLYTDNLTEVFPMKTENGVMEFDLLKRAYNEARYKDEFEPEEAQVKTLFSHVQRLQEEAERLYLTHLNMLDSAI
jgi:HEPN domain-containing protein